MERYFWTKGILKSKIEIVRENEPIGFLVWDSFPGSKVHAMFNERRFLIQRDFFSMKMDIFDEGSQVSLGTGYFNLLSLKGEIVINGKRFELEIKNVWQSSWSWKFNGAALITFQCNDFLAKGMGTIDIFTASTEEIEILVLLGLLVRNQFVSFLVVFFILLLLIIL